jgi:hypothetical protein
LSDIAVGAHTEAAALLRRRGQGGAAADGAETATLCPTLVLLLGSAGMLWSADLQKGHAAYDSGDYATALREWKPLAKQGYE